MSLTRLAFQRNHLLALLIGAFGAALAAALAGIVPVPGLEGASGFGAGAHAPALPEELVAQVMLGAANKLGRNALIVAYSPPSAMLMYLTRTLFGLTSATAARALDLALALLLVALWARDLLRAGYALWLGAVLTLALAANPLFAALLDRGPDTALTALGAWLTARSLLRLSATARVDAIILAGAGLALLLLASPSGVLFAAALLPLLWTAFPDDIRGVRRSGVYLIVLFPLVMAAAFALLASRTLLGDPLAWLLAYAVPVFPDATINRGAVLGTMALALLGNGALLQLALSRTQVPGQTRLAALGLLAATAVWAGLLPLTLAGQTGLDSAAAGLLLACGPTSAAALAAVPGVAREQRRAVLALGLSAVALALVLWLAPPGLPVDRASWSRQLTDRADVAALGAFLNPRDDVMIDAPAHLAVIAARGTAQGLIVPGDFGFDAALLRHRLDASWVVTQRTDPAHNADAIARTFADIHDIGPRGYRLAFARGAWRVWARNDIALAPSISPSPGPAS